MIRSFALHPNWLVLPGLLLVTACATDPGTCDPRRGGFVSGISAMSSGCYDQRISAKQGEVSAGQRLTQQLDEENAALVQEKRMTSAQLRRAEKRLANLQKGNRDLERKITRMKASTPSVQSEKARLQAQLRQNQADTSRLQQEMQSGRVAEQELNREINRLTQERDQIATDIATATAQ